MKTVVFVDGKDFFTGYKKSTAKRLLFQKMAEHMVAGGNFHGLYYYTNTDPENEGLIQFLEMLESKSGFFIKRFEKGDDGVSIALVSDMVRMAATGTYDTAVLLTSTASYLHAVEAVRQLGRKIIVAAWGDVVPSLRRAAFDFINLQADVSIFEQEDEESEETDEHDFQTKQVLRAIEDALDRFNDPDSFLGFNYFCTKWRDQFLTDDIKVRKEIINRLVEEGVLEIYEVNGDKGPIKAIDFVAEEAV